MNPYRFQGTTDKYVDAWKQFGHCTFPNPFLKMGSDAKKRYDEDIFGEYPFSEELPEDIFERIGADVQAEEAASCSQTAQRGSRPANLITLVPPPSEPKRVKVGGNQTIMLQPVNYGILNTLKRRFADIDQSTKYTRVTNPWNDESWWSAEDVINVVVFQNVEPVMQVRLFWSNWYSTWLVVHRKRNIGMIYEVYCFCGRQLIILHFIC